MSRTEAQEVTQASIEFNNRILSVKKLLDELVSVINSVVDEVTNIFDSTFDMYFNMVKRKNELKEITNPKEKKEKVKRVKKTDKPVSDKPVAMVLDVALKNIVPERPKKRSKKLVIHKLETVLESGNVLVSENKNDIKPTEYASL